MQGSSKTVSALLLFTLFAFSMPGTAAANEKKKIYVAPIAPLFQQIPMELGVRTAEFIGKELTAQGRVETVEGPAVTMAEGAQAEEVTPQARAAALRRAENLVGQAREQAGALRFDRAARLYRSALDQYEENLVHITDFGVFVDVHLELAVALFRAGREEEADGYVSDVVRLAPDRKVEGEDLPPVFVTRFESVRDRLVRASRGNLSVLSSPPGAEVIVNGSRKGRTPLRLTSVIPGRHYLRVETPGVPASVRAVDVTTAEPIQVEFSFGGRIEGPVADLIGALSSNRLDAAALRQATAVGRQLGVDYVLFGVIQRGQRNYEIRSYLFELAGNQVYRLSDLRIDLDFLGVAIEVFRMGEEIGEFLGDPPPAVSLPLVVFDGASQVAITYSEVTGGPPVPREEPPRPERQPPGTAVASPEQPERDRPTGPVAPVEPTQPTEPARPVGPVEPARPTEPARSVEPERPVEPVRPVEPERPVEPVPPAEPARPAEPVPPAEPDRPVRDSTDPDRRPFAPVVTGDQPPPTERIEDDIVDDRELVQVGGARGRLLDPDVEPGSQRFAAVDIDEVVIIEDEDGKRRRGWPWWAWGLTAIGVAGIGAGGYYAATELGGSATNAKVTIEW